MRGEGKVLRDVEAETKSLIRYLAPQLEFESEPGPAMRVGSAERPGLWEGGGLNYDGGGDGYGATNAISGDQKRVVYKGYNTLHPGYGGSAAQLFPDLAGIGNGKRNSLPSKPKKRIPPNKKGNKFERIKLGKNKKSPVAQVNTINTSNATPLRPQMPMSDEYNLTSGVAIKYLTATQLLRKARGILKKMRIRPRRYLSYSPR